MSKPIKVPSKRERSIAHESYSALEEYLKTIGSDTAEIEIEETQQRLILPTSALELLATILQHMRKGKTVSIVPNETEVTTQKAAEYLNCSRPFLVKLLEEGEIPYTRIGRHRRVLFSDLEAYRKKQKEATKLKLIQMMKDAEDLDLYD